MAGPPGAPVVVLLHGWTVTADLNFFHVYDALGEHFRVVAPDHRGHGRGLRSRAAFRLEDCADDVAALATVLGIESFVAVGYSLGGTIAQLLWKRHPRLVAGLVLCATGQSFAGTRMERLSFLGLDGLAKAARLAPPQARPWMRDQFLSRKRRVYEPWALEQLSEHDWPAVLAAGGALGRFSSREWIGSIDVPAAVLITDDDRVVPPARQARLADAIPGAFVHHLDAGHDACVAAADRFVPALVAACRSVSSPAR